MASRCSRREPRNRCPAIARSSSRKAMDAARSARASAFVVYPDFVFFVLGRASWSKRTSWSCLGLDRLTSRPMASYAAPAAAWTRASKSSSSFFRTRTSTAIPTSSMSSSVRETASSKPMSAPSSPCSASCSSMAADSGMRAAALRARVSRAASSKSVSSPSPAASRSTPR